MQDLKYRRQFVVSKKELSEISTWQKYSLADKYFLYAHPDLEVNQIESKGKQITLLGIAVDATHPEHTNLDIAKNILENYQTWEDVIEAVYPVGGRYIVFATNKNTNEFKAVADPIGLRTLFFVKDNALPILCASQPLLIADYCNLTIDQAYQQGYLNSGATEKYIEFWHLSPYTQYNEVEHLTPNHYLDFEQHTQHRYYPLKPIPVITEQEGLQKTELYLKNLLKGIKLRGKLTLAITSGYDSRIVLAAAKDLKDDLEYYTGRYYGMKDSHSDLVLPAKLLPQLGVEHQIINCEGQMTPEFEQIFMHNTDMPHRAWGGIVENLYHKFPQDRILIKSACAEIARCAFYKGGYPKKVDPEWIGSISTFEDSPFMMEKLEQWFTETKQIVADKHIDILDIYYWEHRCGYWQAGSQLEFDLAHEEFTPYSCRILLDSMLGVPIEYRAGPQFKFFKKLMHNMWPETLLIPFPTPFQKKIGEFKKSVKRSVFGKAYRKILRTLKIPH